MFFLCNIQVFIEVVVIGSFNLVVENFNIIVLVVSYQIVSLEYFLGKKLFFCSSKGVMLMVVGEKYFKEVFGVLNMIGQVISQVINDIYQDYLCIYLVLSFGLLWLMFCLDKFCQVWLVLKISLICLYESIQFFWDNIDIDICYGLLQWLMLLVRIIKNECVLFYSVVFYLVCYFVQVVEDLLVCDLIYFDSILINWSNWLLWYKVCGWYKNFIFNFDWLYMSIEVVRMGMGVIFESNLLVGGYVCQGQLMLVFVDEWSMLVGVYYFVFFYVNEQKEKVQCFFVWVVGELKEEGFYI